MAGSNNRALFLQVGGNVDGLTTAMRAGRTVLNEFSGVANDTVAEIEAAFTKLGGNSIEESARKVEAAYVRTFNNIKANLASIGGGSDGRNAVDILNANAAQMAADKAQEQAAALRIVADAAARAAAANTEGGSAARIYATAAEAAAVGALHEAEALQAQAKTLGAVQAQLPAAANAQDNLAGAHSRMGNSGFIAEHVVRSLSDSIAAGQSPVRALTMEMGRITEAVSYYAATTEKTSGAVGKFLGVMGGGWGIAISAAIGIGSLLASKVLEGGAALTKETTSLEENAKKAIVAADAKAAFAKTEAGAIDGIRQVTEELKKQNDALKSNAQLQQEATQRNLAIDQKNRASVAAKLARAQSDLNDAKENGSQNGGTVGGSTNLAGIAYAQGQVDRLQARLTVLDKSIADGKADLRTVDANLAGEAAKRATDPTTAINFKYDGADGLITRAKARATAEEAVNGVLEKQLVNLDKQKQAELAAAAKAKSDAARDARAGPLTDFLSPVSGGRVTGRFGETRTGHTHAGIDYAVPVGTPVIAPASGTVDVAGSRSGYGNAIYINFGGGTSARFGHLSKFNVKAGDTVEAGDVIGYTGGAAGADGSGDSTGPHLHYEVRRGGRAIDPTKGRYPTDAGGASDDAERHAQEIKRQAAEAKRKADEAANNDRAYQAQLGQAQDRYARAQLGLSDTAEGRYALEVDELEAARVQRNLEIQDQVTAGKINEKQAEKLTGLNDDTAALAKVKALHDEQSRLLEEQLDRDRAELEGKLTILNLQSQLVTTTKRRRDIALQTLADEEKLAKLAAQKVIDDPNATKAQKDAAEKAKRDVDDQHGLKTQQIDQANPDKLQAYGLQLHQNTDDMNDALKGVAVDGLKGVEDGLVGIIDGTESAATAFKKMAASIIADLARIAIEKLIVKVIGGGFFADGLVPGHADGIIPGFATGVVDGIIQGPGNGRSDSILAFMGGSPIRVSNGESIMTEAATRRYGRALKAMNDNTLPGFATCLVPDASIRYPAWPDAQQMQRASAAPQVIYVSVDKSALFDVHVQRAAAPLATAAIVAGSNMAQTELAEKQSQVIPT